MLEFAGFLFVWQIRVLSVLERRRTVVLPVGSVVQTLSEREPFLERRNCRWTSDTRFWLELVRIYKRSIKFAV